MDRAGENLQRVVRCPRASNGRELLLQPGLQERGGGGLREGCDGALAFTSCRPAGSEHG